MPTRPTFTPPQRDDTNAPHRHLREKRKLAKADLFKAPEGNDQEEGSEQKMCPRIMTRRTLKIPLEDASITIETETEHPQLASIQRAVGTSLRQVAGFRRPVYHRAYLKGDH